MANQQTAINQLQEAQQELTKLLRDFHGMDCVENRVEILNDLFQVWLSNEFPERTQENGEDVAFVTLGLVNFLVKLKDKWERLNHWRSIVESGYCQS
ncbi:hypothetical protein GCM10028806_16200 [Spirosoma terrae]|uniref:Uncharacterized protein n=1 Tax=Spirosoma terrae TaxID=1968276 RepID=A0A6L9LA38_9BACT|nr:hypothetical protein [Spirosoma terrae]NDU95268.1 hypothetical protein [Spirosoma terrae]